MPSNKQIVTLNLSLLPGLLPPLKTRLVQIAIALLVYTIFNLYVVPNIIYRQYGFCLQTTVEIVGFNIPLASVPRLIMPKSYLE